MPDRISDANLARINARARELVDELLAVLDIGDRQCAYFSAMQILLSRCGLGPDAVFHALASLVSHNFCGDAPIRLIVAGAERDRPPPETIN